MHVIIYIVRKAAFWLVPRLNSINHLAVWAFKERRLGVFGYALLDAVDVKIMV